MRNRNVIACSVLLCIFVIGCAAQQSPLALTASGREKGVLIEVKSFEFRPNIIKMDGPQTLSLNIKNVSSTEHNFTLKNPEGEIIKSVNLPEGKTVSVEIVLPRTGTYPFYCDKTFHASLGMKGAVEVSGK
jgi:plastocyanin